MPPKTKKKSTSKKPPRQQEEETTPTTTSEPQDSSAPAIPSLSNLDSSPTSDPVMAEAAIYAFIEELRRDRRLRQEEHARREEERIRREEERVRREEERLHREEERVRREEERLRREEEHFRKKEERHKAEDARIRASIRALHPEDVTPIPGDNAGKPPSPQGRNKKNRDRSKSKDRAKDCCNRCGRSKHADGATCPAVDTTCSHCKNKGHWQAMCRKRLAAEKKKLGAVRVMRTKIEDPAYVQVDVTPLSPSKPSRKVEAKPDSGADVTVMPAKVFKNWQISEKKLSPPTDNMEGAGIGSQLRCNGTFTCSIQLGKCKANTEVWVSPDVSEFLLSRPLCRQLRLIPEDFPKQIASVARGAAALQAEQPGTTSTLEPIPDTPSASDIARIKKRLLSDFADVFSESDELKPMRGDPMKIHVREDAVPFALTTARQVPFALREQVKEEIDKMLAKGIIERVGDVATEWCHPMVAVRKANGKVRITTDLTKLNKHVNRPYYPQKTPKDAVDAIQRCDRFFTTMDALQGYWQIELDPESQLMTTFICSEGRFKYLRAPMGLVSSGDEYNRRGDLAFQDVRHVQKIVDDLLVHNATFSEHVKSVLKVLERCREHNITLNPAKFVFGQEKVDYVGFKVSAQGTEADPAKLAALTEFPILTNLTELRSFFGLVNQLGHFSKDIRASAATPEEEQHLCLDSKPHRSVQCCQESAVLTPDTGTLRSETASNTTD